MKKFTTSFILPASFFMYAGIYTLKAQTLGFTVSPVTGCPSLTVTVTNTSTDTAAYRYEWSFGDGSPLFVDTLTTTFTHTFNQPGYYNIYLYVYDSTGNYISNTYGSTGAVNVLGDVNTSPYDSACANDAVQICGNYQASSWNWDFGDGFSGSSSSYCTNHTYLTNGPYNITLIQTSSYCTDTIIKQIKITGNALPDAYFYTNPPSPANICPNDIIAFYPGYYYGSHFWDLGDSTTSTLANYFPHSYDSTGIFTATHILTNGCGISDTATGTINVSSNNPIPSSVYMSIYPGNTVCPNSAVTFSASSGYYNYIWSFGDGTADDTTASSFTNHAYYTLGNYTVSVHFFNGCGNDTVIYDTISVENTVGFPSPLSFNISYTNTCPGDIVYFYSSSGYLQYGWSYGDGSSSITTFGSTNHIYQYNGTYQISVTITNSCGADTTLYNTVNITGSASFSGSFYFNTNPSSAIACPGHNIQLYTNSGFTKYIWDFGDGNPGLESTASNFLHAYSDTGTYSAIVTIVNGCGADTTLTKSIVIGDSVPFQNIPSFKINVNTTPSCPNTKVLLSSPVGFANYLWDFGDGSPTVNAPLQIQAHYFSDTGTYLVTLIITNHCGMDTTLYAMVNITDDVTAINAGVLTVNPSPACPGQEVSFSITGVAPYYKWDFGDGVIDSVTNSRWAYHSYSQSDTFHYSLTLKNVCGINKTLMGTISIDSSLVIPSYALLDINSTPACPGQEISLSTVSGNQFYVWNFGDGSPLLNNTLSSVNYSYPDTGMYPVSVTITNFCGNNAIFNDTITIGSNVGFLTALSMTVSPQPACPGDRVNITTNDGYSSYLWNFGDSAMAVGTSTADHTYDSVETYNASVTIINQCSIDTVISAPVIISSGIFPALVKIQSGVSSACPGENISFWADGHASNLYKWTFGDGDTVFTTGDEIEHSYDTAGIYITSLTVFNSCGNSRTHVASMTIVDDTPVPQLTILVSSGYACAGDAIQFNAAGGSSSYRYVWNFGDGITDTVIGSAASHNYSDTGTYNVFLTAINPCGNSATFDTIISIIDSLTTQFVAGEGWGISNGSNIGGCPGDAVLFYFQGSGVNLWDFGDGYSDMATEQLVVDQGFIITIIKHAYSDTGTYNVIFTYTNGCGISTTDSMDVIIGNNFLVNGDLLIEEPVTLGGYTTCKPINFVAIGGASYTWDFGDGDTLTSINPTVSHSYQTPGNYSVTVMITNGCGNTIILSRTINIFDVGATTVNTTIVSGITCYNGTDGSISATVTGGESPYTYLWSDLTGQTSVVAVNLAPGDYFVTVTDNLGCVVIDSGTLTNPAPFLLTDSNTASTCGSSDGSATVNVISGGTPPYSYLWSDGSTTQTITGLTAGTYYATVTDANNCSSVLISAVNEAGAPVISIDSVNNVYCNGGNNGTISLSVSGGTLPFTYYWSNGSVLKDLSFLTAGTYILTLTDSAGCKSSIVAEVTQPSPLSLSFTSTGTNCGTSNGSATVNATGGTGSYTYLWDDGQSSQTATGLPAGTFMVTVTDANGCTADDIASVSNTNAPVITSTINNVTCFGMSNGSILQSITGGTTPYQRSWSSGEQSNNIYSKQAGVFTCYITDASGCITVRSYTLTQPALLTATATATTASCGNNDGSALVVASGGTIPYSYLWTSGSTSSLASGLIGGTFTVTVTDSKGCDTTTPATVNVVAATQQICIVTVDSLTNKNLVSWEKTTGFATEGFILYKEVSLNVYDSIGYVSFDSLSAFTDISSDPKTKSERYKISTVDSCSNISAKSTAHRTMHLNASPGMSIERNLTWDNYEGFVFGLYHIWRGTSATNITLIDSIVSSSNTYSDWDTLTGVDSLFYIIEVVPSAPCISTVKVKKYNSSKSNTASLEAPTLPMTFTVTTTDVTCNGGGDGIAAITVSGGKPNFIYIWSTTPPQNTQNATGLSAGNYQVTVVDANNDTLIANAAITEPAVLLIDSLTATKASCPPPICPDGTASVYASGGTPPYVYLWSNGETTDTVTGLISDTFYVTVTDVKGCIIADTVIVDFLVEEKEFLVPGYRFQIYPNPNSGEFTITWHNENYKWKMATVKMYNIFGQEVFQSPIYNQKPVVSVAEPSKISLSGLSGGIYTLKLEADGVLVGVKRMVLVR